MLTTETEFRGDKIETFDHTVGIDSAFDQHLQYLCFRAFQNGVPLGGSEKYSALLKGSRI